MWQDRLPFAAATGLMDEPRLISAETERVPLERYVRSQGPGARLPLCLRCGAALGMRKPAMTWGKRRAAFPQSLRDPGTTRGKR